MVRRAEVIRTCVGCRARASTTELLRVVASVGVASAGIRLVPDPDRRLAGRGAHIHPVPECLTQALRKRAFGRALRLSAPQDVTELETYVFGREDAPTRTSKVDTTVSTRESKVGRPDMSTR